MNPEAEKLKKQIEVLERCLPYADGKQYGKDKQKIKELREKLCQLKDTE